MLCPVCRKRTSSSPCPFSPTPAKQLDILNISKVKEERKARNKILKKFPALALHLNLTFADFTTISNTTFLPKIWPHQFTWCRTFWLGVEDKRVPFKANDVFAPRKDHVPCVAVYCHSGTGGDWEGRICCKVGDAG